MIRLWVTALWALWFAIKRYWAPPRFYTQLTSWQRARWRYAEYRADLARRGL